jgi:aminoglycoside 6'-N-acetyltransferase I
VKTVRIRPLELRDRAEWLRMRRALWPELAGTDESDDADAWLARVDATVLVAERDGGTGLAGVIELGARAYADGCGPSRDAYLEGWYVDHDLRRRGIGASLARAGEQWARARGYRELASDALLSNTTSHRAHESLGFSEVERAVRYRKEL